VVAGAGRDDAAGPLLGGQPGDARVGAADLERTGALEVLALEPDRTAHPLGQTAVVPQRGGADDTVEDRRRGFDVRTGHEWHVIGHGSDPRRARAAGIAGIPRTGRTVVPWRG
jgi:hypothetical protein